MSYLSAIYIISSVVLKQSFNSNGRKIWMALVHPGLRGYCYPINKIVKGEKYAYKKILFVLFYICVTIILWHIAKTRTK